MDAKCYITSCDILDIGQGIVNELAYGIDCEQAKYCNFARYYIEADLQQLLIINNGEPDVDNPDPITPEIPVDPDIPEIPENPEDPDNPVVEGVVNVSFSYTDFVCQVIEQITTTTTTSTTTTTTTTINCYVDFIITAVFITTTTTTTSTTTSTTTTLLQLPSCNIQVDILEITW